MGISLLCLEEMNMCDENMNLEEQVTEPVEPKVETEPLFEEMVDFDTCLLYTSPSPRDA